MTAPPAGRFDSGARAMGKRRFIRDPAGSRKRLTTGPAPVVPTGEGGHGCTGVARADAVAAQVMGQALARAELAVLTAAVAVRASDLAAAAPDGVLRCVCALVHNAPLPSTAVAGGAAATAFVASGPNTVPTLAEAFGSEARALAREYVTERAADRAAARNLGHRVARACGHTGHSDRAMPVDVGPHPTMVGPRGPATGVPPWARPANAEQAAAMAALGASPGTTARRAGRCECRHGRLCGPCMDGARARDLAWAATHPWADNARGILRAAAHRSGWRGDWRSFAAFLRERDGLLLAERE